MIFDYDGTLTYNGHTIPKAALDALQRVKHADLATLGIISGRDLPFLENVNLEASGVFSFLVAENGAISKFESSGVETILGQDWAERARKVFSNSKIPIRFARVIGATSLEHAEQVSEVLEKSGLDSKLVPNKDSLMILPPNVDKGTGVAATLQYFGSTKKIFLTCFGDGENDLALFAPADQRVAVANAVDALKQIADVVTKEPGGLGVAEYLNEKYFASFV
jgi:hydroxymethylpyrimidine pyrophosphatase-like HAD family hydrolase